MNPRSQFPIFQNHPQLIYLDSASTAQRPQVVLDALNHYYTQMNANVHRGLYPLSEQATTAYESVRKTAQSFLNAPSEREIVFTSGTTAGLNLVARGWGDEFLNKGDEILLTVMEHHSNLVPWQLLAQRTGAVLKFVPLTEAGILDYDAMDSLLNPRTRLVAVTGLSNTIGAVTDLRRVVSSAHGVGALVCVDAAQYAAHFPIDVQALDVDFLAFSSHKIYGPTGAGVLYAKAQHLEAMSPWLGGGDMIREVHLDHSTWNDVPWKFEAGTPHIAQVIGLGAAMNFVMELGWDWIQNHDRQLHEYAFSQLHALSGVSVLGSGSLDSHRGSLSFTFEGVHPHDVAALLGESNVCVRAGHHCTMPLMKALGVPSTTRMSFGVYNTMDDVAAAVKALDRVKAVFNLG